MKCHGRELEQTETPPDKSSTTDTHAYDKGIVHNEYYYRAY